MKLNRAKLQQAREMLGYGIETTAEEAGVSKNSVLRAEHEEDIRPVTARKIAGALEVRVADLIGESETLKAQPALPLDLEQRRESAQRLIDAGVSEATARGVSGVDSRSEEYWRALAKASGLGDALEDERRQAIYAPWSEFIDRYAARWEEKIAHRALDGGAVAEFVATLEDLGPILRRLGLQEKQEQRPDFEFTYGPIIGQAIGRLMDLLNPLIEAGAEQAEESDLERLRRRREEFVHEPGRAASG